MTFGSISTKNIEAKTLFLRGLPSDISGSAPGTEEYNSMVEQYNAASKEINTNRADLFQKLKPFGLDACVVYPVELETSKDFELLVEDDLLAVPTEEQEAAARNNISLAAMFSQTGWTCEQCNLVNKPTCTLCVSCKAHNPDASQRSHQRGNSSGSVKATASPQAFSFGFGGGNDSAGNSGFASNAFGLGRNNPSPLGLVVATTLLETRDSPATHLDPVAMMRPSL